MATEQPTTGGQLYVVSTPIGNPDDLTIRGLAVLQHADIIVCEQRTEAQKLLAYYDIDKELLELNEHNDAEATVECVKLLAAGKNLALISDAGTPVLADPGGLLVAAAIRYGYSVHVVPGPSSIIAALVRSGMPTDQFLYAGFLSRKKEQRQQQIELLALEPRTVVLLDTPYRLTTVLNALADVMPERRAYIGCNLTMSNEAHHYGTLAELRDYFTEHRFRGEYAIVIEGNPSVAKWYAHLAGAAHSSTVNGHDETATSPQPAPQKQAATGEQQQQHEELQTTAHTPTTPQHQQPQHRRRYHHHHHHHRHHRSHQQHRRPARSDRYESSRYDYEQPIVNYTLSNPYQQHPPVQQEHRQSVHPRRPKKRWRR
jgi:16S rRNA (cytidine1402-2'-O)-methyltransferase